MPLSDEPPHTAGTAGTSHPRLSFVIPAFNEDVLIGRCLEALTCEIARSGCNAEIAVVNNASTDDTANIASRFPLVRVVEEPKKGIVYARHRGFVETTGELVANLDADTVMPKGWIDTVLDEFDGNRNLVALSGPIEYYDLPGWQQALVHGTYVVAYLFHLLLSALRVGSVVQGGNFVIRRSSWEAAGGFDRRISFYGEDTDVGRRLIRFGEVKWTFRLPMVASGRRLEAEGIFATGLRYILNYIWVTFLGRPLSRHYTDVRSAAPSPHRATDPNPDRPRPE
jgi:cellulose synthase/poly-beta-1,6-N-acetylglucosamine synthase-like glycosyltransferase